MLLLLLAVSAAAIESYPEAVKADKPIAYWRFGGNAETQLENSGSAKLVTKKVGNVVLGQPGARKQDYPRFELENKAASWNGETGFLRVEETGMKNQLAFDAGDSITLEAWVRPSRLDKGQYAYVVGKGRTGDPEFSAENQNYALRLLGEGVHPRLTFLFRSRANGNQKSDYHRWTSVKGVPIDGYWHHIAITYKFGDGKSLRAYIDGKDVSGTWDMGGATNAAPVVDEDAVWIGSAKGGSPGNTYRGLLDEVAIYRTAISGDRMAERYYAEIPAAVSFDFEADIPTDSVRVDIFEDIPLKVWPNVFPEPTTTFAQSEFAFVDTPKKYSAQGVIDSRGESFITVARTKRELLAGEYKFITRARCATRFYIDGKLVLETPFSSNNASGHEGVPKLPPIVGDAYPLAPGHHEAETTVKIEGGEHSFRWEVMVGGNKKRVEIGEPLLAIVPPGRKPELLAANGASPVMLTATDWYAFAEKARLEIDQINRENRKRVGPHVIAFWKNRRTEVAAALRSWEEVAIPPATSGLPASNNIDHFINEKLAAQKASVTPPLNDHAFLKRLALDTVGQIPTPAEIAQFMADPEDTRRQLAIDRYLADDRWADHWVSYWQDLLAENPGILKPKLNNTGPFRFWIHESLTDNKPLDRFATELVLMQGARFDGGPAGFSMATQNDAPLAAKAHLLANAFLSVDMKCARCHDAPFQPYKQSELFGMAAMLQNKTMVLPKTSTVPETLPGGRAPAIESTLKPGAKIDPHWSFVKLSPLDDNLARVKNDAPRAQLARQLTAPTNRRFPAVMVNRIWARYLGVGLVSNLDDWHDVEPSHPELLEYLARELVAANYDQKAIARLIFNSNLYQRTSHSPPYSDRQQFAGPITRRMSAEQIVDSLFGAAEKQIHAEPLTLDPEGRRDQTTFMNLGVPRRAWEFTSLSNERDRPALALPMAQSVVDLLLSFGWRDARPNPISERELAATVIQPLSLANGVASNRAVRLSDDHAVTELCLQAKSPEQVVDGVFLRFLSRPPTSVERTTFAAELRNGFDERIDPKGEIQPCNALRYRNAVSWSNHLHADATTIKLELQKLVEAGDPATNRLQPEWREAAEDMIWSLINSPEFLFVP